MRTGKLALKIGAIVLALSMCAAVVWWRDKVNRERNPWAYPENHARILAEARVNGDAIKLKGSDGKTYYLMMPGTKSGIVFRPEDIDYRSLWRSSQEMPEENKGIGTRDAKSHIHWSGLSTYYGGRLEVEVTVDEVPEGTTAEELMARETK